VELLRHPCARGQLDQFSGPGDGALHATFLGCQIECGAVSEHQPPPLERHRFGHHQYQLVALDRGNHRQADSGIAARRFDDRTAGPERAGILRVLDHSQRNAILDRTAGIGALAFDPDFMVGKKPRKTNVRGVANGGEDVVGLHVAGALVSVTGSRWRKRESNVFACRSSGKIAAQSAVTTIAPTPPMATAPTAPSTAAMRPARNSPSSFEAEIARPEMAETRPRMESGVLS